MNQVNSQVKMIVALTLTAWVALAAGNVVVAQQSTDQHAQHKSAADSSAQPDLSAELESLRGKVLALEAALAKQHQSRYGTDPTMQQGSMTKQPMSSAGGSSQDSMKMDGMKMGDKKMDMKKGMGGMKSMNSDAGSDSSKSKGMGMMGGGMGMGMMGRNPAMKSSMGGMSSTGNMTMPSALPGFPGASHIYHIGETGFFLDHPQHITLTAEQQKQLNEIKESALLATSTAERKTDEAEQELWQLTAADQPDIKKIEAKTKEIGELNASMRIEFIRAVGKAAEVLNEDQRQTLVGMANDAKQ